MNITKSVVIVIEKLKCIQYLLRNFESFARSIEKF